MAPKTLSEALEFIFSYLEPFPKPVAVPTRQALGRILAEDITADAALPRFDNAAMDGFAVRLIDLGHDGRGVDLKIVATIAAGQTILHKIGPGEAARITTGAMLPQGADRVIMQENARMDGDRVRLFTTVSDKSHVRRVGDDIELSSRISRGRCADWRKPYRPAVCARHRIAARQSPAEGPASVDG